MRKLSLAILMAFSFQASAHLAPDTFVSLIADDTTATVKAFLEADTGLTITSITQIITIDQDVDGIGLGQVILGGTFILDVLEVDSGGRPTTGFWEHSVAFPPDVTHHVASFDVTSPIGPQVALYDHREADDIFNAGLFTTDEFSVGMVDHGWTDISFYVVEYAAIPIPGIPVWLMVALLGVMVKKTGRKATARRVN